MPDKRYSIEVHKDGVYVLNHMTDDIEEHRRYLERLGK